MARKGYNFACDISDKPVLSSYKVGSKIEITVKIVNILYGKKDTGFYIYEVEADYRRFNIVGAFPFPLMMNGFYRINGVVDFQKNKWQVNVESSKSVFPEDEAGILAVLQTLHGLDTQAYKVYSILGKSSLTLIRDNPDEVVRAVKGLSIKHVLVWQEQLRSKEQIDESLSMLLSSGVSAAKAKELLEKYGPGIGESIKNNPYFLVSDAGVLSFSVCDKLALKNGYPLDGLERIRAAILQVLSTAATMYGHCYLPEKELLEQLRASTGLFLKYSETQSIIKKSTSPTYCWSQFGMILEVSVKELKSALEKWKKQTKRPTFSYPVYQISEDKIGFALESLLGSRKLVQEVLAGNKIYSLFRYYDAERRIVSAIHDIQLSMVPLRVQNQQFIDAYCKKNRLELEEKQKQAVLDFTSNAGGIYILNGGAGCGKTFTLKVILNVLKAIYQAERKTFSARIIAPTGKAAKVAHNSTSLEANTIHKELGLIGDDESMQNNIQRIEVSCLIIDEFSMVDVALAAKLFSNISPTTKVIIVGDTEQLPSIGPGMVLHDLITSNAVHVVTLDVVKRQTVVSKVLENANKIIAGQMITTEVSESEGIQDDAYLFVADTTIDCCSQIVNTVVDLVVGNGFSISDIQVLCPQKKTDIGTDALNLLLQKALNPIEEEGRMVPSKEVAYNGITETLYFKAGDKVIHVKNNYSMEWLIVTASGQLVKDPCRIGIINGETGIVQSALAIKTDSDKLIYQVLVKYDYGYVLYQNDFSELQHAYAMTIHKSQGSQWPIVISPIMNCNSMMLNRKLLYTMYTRAQETNFIFGEMAAVQKAITNNASARRYTCLKYRLEGCL